MTMSELQDLKKALHPELTINIVDQAETVANAIEQETMGTQKDLAQYLEVSPNWVQKMYRANKNALPELKTYFKGIKCGMNAYYQESSKSHEEQRAWLHSMEILTV